METRVNVRDYISIATGSKVDNYPVYVIPGNPDSIVVRLDEDNEFDVPRYAVLRSNEDGLQLYRVMYNDDFFCYDDNKYQYSLGMNYVSRGKVDSDIIERVQIGEFVKNNFGYIYYSQTHNAYDLKVTQLYPYVLYDVADKRTIEYESSPYAISVETNISDPEKRTSFALPCYKYKIIKTKRLFMTLPEKAKVYDVPKLQMEGIKVQNSIPKKMMNVLCNKDGHQKTLQRLIDKYNNMKSNS